MWNFIKFIASPLGALIKGGYKAYERKKELDDIKHARQIEALMARETAEFVADMQRTKGLVDSWKDEFITILISIPVIMCFMGPEAAQIVKDGFSALDTTPGWFQWIIVGVYSVGAGIPLTGKGANVIKSIVKK